MLHNLFRCSVRSLIAALVITLLTACEQSAAKREDATAEFDRLAAASFDTSYTATYELGSTASTASARLSYFHGSRGDLKLVLHFNGRQRTLIGVGDYFVYCDSGQGTGVCAEGPSRDSPTTFTAAERGITVERRTPSNVKSHEATCFRLSTSTGNAEEWQECYGEQGELLSASGAGVAILLAQFQFQVAESSTLVPLDLDMLTVVQLDQGELTSEAFAPPFPLDRFAFSVTTPCDTTADLILDHPYAGCIRKALGTLPDLPIPPLSHHPPIFDLERSDGLRVTATYTPRSNASQVTIEIEPSLEDSDTDQPMITSRGSAWIAEFSHAGWRYRVEAAGAPEDRSRFDLDEFVRRSIFGPHL